MTLFSSGRWVMKTHRNADRIGKQAGPNRRSSCLKDQTLLDKIAADQVRQQNLKK